MQSVAIVLAIRFCFTLKELKWSYFSNFQYGLISQDSAKFYIYKTSIPKVDSTKEVDLQRRDYHSPPGRYSTWFPGTTASLVKWDVIRPCIMTYGGSVCKTDSVNYYYMLSTVRHQKYRNMKQTNRTVPLCWNVNEECIISADLQQRDISHKSLQIKLRRTVITETSQEIVSAADMATGHADCQYCQPISRATGFLVC